MSFGEWCATVLAVIFGALAVAGMAAFTFIMALRWPLALIISAYLISKAI
jgi:hypothetical protein